MPLTDKQTQIYIKLITFIFWRQWLNIEYCTGIHNTMQVSKLYNPFTKFLSMHIVNNIGILKRFYGGDSVNF